MQAFFGRFGLRGSYLMWAVAVGGDRLRLDARGRVCLPPQGVGLSGEPNNEGSLRHRYVLPGDDDFNGDASRQRHPELKVAAVVGRLDLIFDAVELQAIEQGVPLAEVGDA